MPERRLRLSYRIGLTAWLGCFLLAFNARADRIAGVSSEIGTTDGAYGRFRGDNEWNIGLGPELAFHELQHAGPRLRAQLEWHYFWSAGAYAAVSQTLSRKLEDGTIVTLGISFRPAFLPRFAFDTEQGPARLDLFIDSIALQIGAYGVAQGGFKQRGLETALEAAVPIMADAEGIWIGARGGMRLGDEPLAGTPFQLTLLVSYRFLWRSPAIRY